ncbi:MAG: hypothetical protein KGI37_08400 [Alphaproteobacteria bacterium]|nr:hypothetical protein [Alphaproteobacteria bacterium]
MKNIMKQELLNDVLTGLMIAATFTAIVPADALAQNLAAVGSAAQNGVMDPFVKFASYASYALGTVMVVVGISDAKKHADNPGQNKLGPALGKLAAGGAFLAAPAVASTMTGTLNNVSVTGGGASFTNIGGM